MLFVAQQRDHAREDIVVNKELRKFLTQELELVIKQITGESALEGILRPLELNYRVANI